VAAIETALSAPAVLDAIRRSRLTSTGLPVAALIALFTLAWLFRFLSIANGFTNDHFIHLANAQQVRFGDWPTRDFLDAGMPLMYVVSATADYVFGHTLFSEAVLVALAFAAAAVLTVLAVRELTGSWLLGFWAAALEVAIVPRAYGYPKILTYAAVFFLLQRYVSRPGTARLLTLAAGIAVAFLFRHDHGAYLAVGSALAALLVPPGGAGLAERVRRVLTLGAAVAALLLPYVAFVHVHRGLWQYLQVGLEFGAREFKRSPYEWPTLSGADALQAPLFYQYWALPVAAVLLLAALRRRSDIGVLLARVIPLVAVASLLTSALARPPFASRLPDAVVPAVMMAAWVIAVGWNARPRWLGRPAAAAVFLAFAASVVASARTVDRLDDAGLLRPPREWGETVRQAERRLLHPYQLIPSAQAQLLVPFYEYLDRCTTREHRLLIVGLITEVSYFAQRPFAGGQVALVSGYFEGDAYQRDVVRALQGQTAPFVVIPGPAVTESLDGSFPIVGAYVRDRYLPFVEFGDARSGVKVLFDTVHQVARYDDLTGWPCLTGG
jgi:hypothetical protein